jgi:hypothetical protein
MIKYFAPILIALGLIAGAFFVGKDYGLKGEKVECQKTVILNQNENTQSLVKSTQIRNQINALPDDAIWSELFSKYCTDCDK